MRGATLHTTLLVLLASSLYHAAVEDCSASQLRCRQQERQLQRPPLLGRRHPRARPRRGGELRWSLAARESELVAMGGGGWAAAGGLAGIALASEVFQVAMTFVAVFVLNRATGAKGLSELVEVVAEFMNGLGWYQYPAFAASLHAITILPLMSAILFIVLAGTLFGVVKGTALVSLSLSSAAAISATIARRIAAARGYGMANIDPRAAAVDAAIAKEPWHKGLLLVTLLRLSPVLPFTFSNYLAGLTSLPIPTFFLGTLLGTLPTQAVYVGAGAIGRKALQGGVKLPKSIVFLGIAATILAILLIGRVATQTLQHMDLAEIEADTGRKAKRP